MPGEHKNGDILSALHSLGVNLSLDDFGTGFTAFSQLIDYPVDILKIDRMFINEIHQTESRDRPLVDIIVEVAKLYHLEVVAEGVETEEQLNYVRALGCQLVQGYFLSKPLPEMEFVLLLKKKNRLVSEIILDKEGNDDLSSPRCQVL